MIAHIWEALTSYKELWEALTSYKELSETLPHLITSSLHTLAPSQMLLFPFCG